MKKKGFAISGRLRALVQSEINYTRPFCSSRQAGCFEVQYLDTEDWACEQSWRQPGT